jgi:hypothetical protein
MLIVKFIAAFVFIKIIIVPEVYSVVLIMNVTVSSVYICILTHQRYGTLPI